jgi:hypothetical protein
MFINLCSLIVRIRDQYYTNNGDLGRTVAWMVLTEIIYLIRKDVNINEHERL